MVVPPCPTCCTETKDIYLTPDERYEVWTVKAAERPELLRFVDEPDDLYDDDDHNSDEEEENSHIPLQDGCDIPGWRRQGIMVRPISAGASSTLSILNVGQGCSLLRRESQIPFFPTTAPRHRLGGRWLELRQKLLSPSLNGRSMPRIDCSSTKPSRHPWFERSNVPAVLDHAMDTWPAMQTMQWEALVRNFGYIAWRFSDTHGETLPLQTYDKYASSLECATDDAPLAVYDSQFGYDDDDSDTGEGSNRKRLLDDYQVPACFDGDLLEDCLQDYHEQDDDSHRPPFRWILMGPERSGTGLHVDPVGTHAWVALIEGCKRWVLFPPHVDRTIIGMQTDNENDEDASIPAAIWMADGHYDRAVEAYRDDMVEYVQRPGEIVYVPAGWPHLVVNLDRSVAVTHNYASEYPSLERLQQALRTEEPALAERFQAGLERHRPDLLAVAQEQGGGNCSEAAVLQTFEESSPRPTEPCS